MPVRRRGFGSSGRGNEAQLGTTFGPLRHGGLLGWRQEGAVGRAEREVLLTVDLEPGAEVHEADAAGLVGDALAVRLGLFGGQGYQLGTKPLELPWHEAVEPDGADGEVREFAAFVRGELHHLEVVEVLGAALRHSLDTADDDPQVGGFGAERLSEEVLDHPLGELPSVV